MNEVDTRLRDILERVASTTQVTHRVDEIVWRRKRRPVGLLVAGAAFVAVFLLVGIPAIFFSSPDEPEPLGSPGEPIREVDPAWLTVEDEDLAVFDELRPEEGPAGERPGPRPTLVTERIWCLYTDGPGSATSVSHSLALDEKVSAEVMKAACERTDTVPEAGVATLTFCRGVHTAPTYQEWVESGEYTIVGGEVGAGLPGFPVVLGWESDCRSERRDTNPPVLLDAELSFEAINLVRQIEIAVWGAAYRNCLGYDQATALASAARQELGEGWLMVESSLAQTEAEGCYQPVIDLEFGAVYVSHRWFEDEENQSTSPSTVPPHTNQEG